MIRSALDCTNDKSATGIETAPRQPVLGGVVFVAAILGTAEAPAATEAAAQRALPENPRWLTQGEAANMLGVSSRTVANWRVSGELPSSLFGRSRRYALDDLKNFANTRRDVTGKR